MMTKNEFGKMCKKYAKQWVRDMDSGLSPTLSYDRYNRSVVTHVSDVQEYEEQCNTCLSMDQRYNHYIEQQ